MAEAGVIATTSKSPEEFKAYLAEDAKKWSEVIKRTGPSRSEEALSSARFATAPSLTPSVRERETETP